jgi:anti-anti-sigma regulatory factor
MAAHNREGVIKLANLTPRVEEVLRITGLARLFDVHDSETEAVEAFSRSSTAAVTTSL